MSNDKRKPVLYWTIIARWGMGYVVLAVTSEGPGRRINGRLPNGEPTHTMRGNITGKFTSQSAATALTDTIKAIREKYEALRKPHKDEITRLIGVEETEIKGILHAEQDR